MPKYLDPVNYNIFESDEDPLTLGMMGYTPYGYTIEATPPNVDPVNYQTYIPDPVRAYQPTPTTTSTKVPIKNEYTGEDVNYEIPMGFNPTQYAVNNPNTTKETAFQDYLTNPNNKGWGGPTENTFMSQMAGPANVPSEGGFGYIPTFAGDITPDIVEALKSYPQYYDAFDPSQWDVGTYNFMTGNTASADPSQGAFDTAAMRNRKTGEWLSFANAYKMYPHEAQQIWDMYQATKAPDRWFESDFLQPVLKKIFSAIPTIIGSAAGNYILPGIGGAVGGAIGGVAGQSVAGNPVSWSNWRDQVIPAVAGGVAGYYGGDWAEGLGAESVPLTAAEDVALDASGSLWDAAKGLLSAEVPQGAKDAAMFLGMAPQKNPVYDLEKDFLGQASRADITNLANRSSNEIGTDFMNTATETEQGKAFDMYTADMERAQMEQLAMMEEQRQQMLGAREQEYMAKQRAYEEYLNSVIPRMQQAYTYTSPFDYKVPDTASFAPGETVLTEEDTPNVYYAPEVSYRQQQSELARRGIRRGSKNTSAFI